MENNKFTSNNTSSNKFHKFFKNLDFFSITFQFRIGKRQKYASFCGGLSFSLFILLILAYVLKSFFDYISFEDKKIQFIQKYDDKINLLINNKTFFYSFKFTYIDRNLGLKAQEAPVIGSSYEKYFLIERYYVKVFGENETKIFKGNKILSSFRNCSHINISDFQKEKSEQKTQISENTDNDLASGRSPQQPKIKKKSNLVNTTDHLCFEYPEMQFYGQYSDNEMAYMEIILKLNETLFKQNATEIENVFTNVLFKFALYNSDHIYDISNHLQPVTQRVESKIYSYIDVFSYEKKTIFLQELNYAQDNNLLTKSPRNSKHLTLSYYERELLPMLNRFSLNKEFKDKYNLLKFFFRADIKKVNMMVSLIKIPEFISGVGAIVTNSMLVLNIVVSYFNNFHAKQKIIRKIMKYGDAIKENNKEDISFFAKNFEYAKGISTDRSKTFNYNDNSLKYVNNNYNKNNENNKNNILRNIGQLNDSIDPKAPCVESTVNNVGFERNLNNKANKPERNFELSDRSNNLLNLSGFTNKINNSVIEDNFNNNNNYYYRYNKVNFQDRKSNDNLNNISKEMHLNTLNKLSELGLYSNNIDNNNNNLKLNAVAIENKNLQNFSKTEEVNSKIINYDNKLKQIHINLHSYKAANLKDENQQRYQQQINLKNLSNHGIKNLASKLEIKNSNKKTEIYISSWELIQRRLCCKAAIKPKLNIFSQAENTIYKNMDILNYFKRMHEIEILKFLILDENLLELMNFISKPCIYNRRSQNKIRDKEIELFFNRNSSENAMHYCMDSLKHAFNRVIAEDNQKNSFVKSRMMKIFEHEIKELL